MSGPRTVDGQRRMLQAAVSLVVALEVLVCLAVYLGSVVVRADGLQQRSRRWQGRLYGSDPVLGYFHRPAARDLAPSRRRADTGDY